MGVQERRAREFVRREQEILDAALALFAGDDWQAVTIDQIAQRAEVAKGTIYKHFDTKDEIYARLALDVHRRILADLERVPPDQGAVARLSAVIAIVWEHQTTAGREQQRVVQFCERDDLVPSLPERTRSQMVAVGSRMTEIIFDILGQGVAEGIFPDRPLPLLLFGAQSALVGAVRQVWTGCVLPAEHGHYLAEITSFILAGLTHDHTRERRAAA